MVSDISYTKAGYKNERWKWVLSISNKENLTNHNSIAPLISQANLLQVYGLDKPPKLLPCRKKCNSNPWCLVSISRESQSNASRLTEQSRDMDHPIGLENTANTCWINSALQALFHIHLFRNCINSIDGFQGEESLSSLDYLLQAMFIEMELHDKKALACSTGSIFEKLAIFVTKEIMQKDQDYQVLKCVSEFLENTIDNLLGNSRTGPQISPLFRTTLYRVAKWRCAACQKEHIRQLLPDTCYMMAAYVSADECPLDQCILDLQTETQTGVSLVCGEDDGCGATVKVDRIVTPKILNLPSLLIIRNNSLMDRELKRRLHVVYPETLDLTSHTFNHEAAPYSLRAVIYHHGHWIKHFSAHVKTEDGKWFNFNDEKVNGLVPRPGNCHPLETHKDYFSIASVANKYKSRSQLRVSKGAFIWIYERDSMTKEKALLHPLNAVLEYVLTKQKSRQAMDIQLIEERRKERSFLFEKLSVVEAKNELVSLISRPLLLAWLVSQDTKFMPQPSLLVEGMCEHRRFNPIKIDSFKCIRRVEVENLLSTDCGIHSNDKIPLTYTLDEAFCLLCVTWHTHHILFREGLKELHKMAKKMSAKEPKIDTTLIGTVTLSNWMKLALSAYMKEMGLEEVDNCSEDDQDQGFDEEVPLKEAENPLVISEQKKQVGSSISCVSPKENGAKANEGEDAFAYLNQDIVCPHGMIDPKASVVWLPNSLVGKMKQMCIGAIHPATCQEAFSECSICKDDLDKTLETCSSGKAERKRLYHLLVEKRRPHRSRDSGQTLYLLSREFLREWKSFVRLCAKDDQEICRPMNITNSILLCKHNKLLYPCTEDSSLHDFAVIIWEDEWNFLKEIYPFDHSIEVHYDKDGCLSSKFGLCEEGCVETEAAKLYEEQFIFENKLIYVKQVHSAEDIPGIHIPSEMEEPNPTKKPRLTEALATETTSSRTASQRLVRASKMFSSSDTIKEIQNFIAEKTGIWPLLQTLWLAGGNEHGPMPFLLNDKHRSMTLHALRIKAEDTIYFRATMEDLERAAGDGETEYNEIIIEET